MADSVAETPHSFPIFEALAEAVFVPVAVPVPVLDADQDAAEVDGVDTLNPC